ncbi:hypothetical protein MHM93_01605 [Pseudoalteromonas sp. MM17-2]|uniref:hypothetical protein n=1 Tax=Pseudoalteromonas sp. MM17-2 TaxID=2917753 RepID=UPI001EF6BFDA|nr:hypothetical protein [Pseudoalteromonas sp. MM17-2]MCG7542875.1 hypothetical protein [Pseudoalteromonas sp. MM17-2]
MDVYLGQAGLVVGIFVGVTSIAVAFNRIYTNYSSQNYKKVELYRQLQKLCGTDASTNLPEILVTLRFFTRAHLTNKEIEWFIWAPGAFRYLPEYGRKIEFIEINYETNSFKWRSKFTSAWCRLWALTLMFIGYFIAGVLGVVLLMLVWKYFDFNGAIQVILLSFLALSGVILLALAYIFLRRFLTLLPPERLVDTNLRGDTAD